MTKKSKWYNEDLKKINEFIATVARAIKKEVNSYEKSGLLDNELVDDGILDNTELLIKALKHLLHNKEGFIEFNGYGDWVAEARHVMWSLWPDHYTTKYRKISVL